MRWIVRGLFVAAAILSYFFFEAVFDTVTGGRWQLDPIVSPAWFGAGLVIGVFLLYLVFYEMYYEVLLNDITRHPRRASLIAMVVWIGASLLWLFIAVGLYYFWWVPAPSLEASPLLASVYPFVGILGILAVTAVGWLVWRFCPKR